MAYIGQNADGNFTTSVSKDTFSGNGSATAFTLSEAATTNTVDVFVENIRQEPTTAYTVDGTTLTFTAAPVTGTNNIYVVNRGPIQLSASHPAAQSLSAFSATITNDLTVDTNTLFVDASADKVAMGTTSADGDASVLSIKGTDPAQIYDGQIIIHGSATSGAADTGAGIGFKGHHGTGNRNLGAIQSLKENATSGNIDTYMRFVTRSNSGGLAERWRIGSNGNFKAATDGVGIDFSASAGSGASSSVLDDYEEGTWTPAITQGWTSVSYTNSYQFGKYTKIGNMVTAWFWLQFSGTSAGNQVLIGGLPFTAPGAANIELAHRGGAVTYFNTPVTAAGAITAYTSGTTIQFFAYDDGGASALSNANASSDFLIGSVTYWIE